MSQAPDLAEVLATVRAFVLAKLPGEVPDRITVHLVSGRKLSAPVPLCGMTPPNTLDPAPLPGELTECEQDILRVIEEAGERLTTAKVMQALQEQSCIHGDSTVIHSLADLCRRKGRLTNRKDGHGRGYGLADWS